MRGCSLLFVAANGERLSPSHPLPRRLSSEEKSETAAKTSPDSKQIAESEAESVAQEKKADTEENANPGKEEEEEREKASSGKKKSKASPTPSPKKSPIAEASFAAGGTNNTVADATRHVTPVPTVRPSVSPGSIPQVEVEKSGFLGDQGYEPPPSPTPRRGWWFWSRPEVDLPVLFRGLCEMKSTGRRLCGAAGNLLSYTTVAHDRAAPVFSIIITGMFAG